MSEFIAATELDKFYIAVMQRDALARACRRALIDLRAARTLAQHTLGEPHGINQTIEIIESALDGFTPAVDLPQSGER